LSVKSMQPNGTVGASNQMKRMRYALTLLLLTTLAAAQAPAGNQPSAPAASAPAAESSDQANAAKARRIVDQGIQALGGQAYLTWRTQSSEGRSYSFHHGEPNSVGTLFWRFKQYPDKERVEVTKKRDIVEIFNGDKGYEVTFRGVRDLEDKTELQPFLRRRHYALDIVMREWLNAQGVAFFYEGQTVAAQKQTDQVTIMNSKNEAVTQNFDINSHLPVKKSFTWRDPTDRERNVEEEIYDNYRPIQGVMTPFDLTRTYNGDMASQVFLTVAAYNKDFVPTMFDAQASAGKRK
jgi:hypothetical protein